MGADLQDFANAGPLAVAIEVVAVMDGYECKGQPGWGAEPCNGPPCGKHHYRPLDAPGRNAALAYHTPKTIDGTSEGLRKDWSTWIAKVLWTENENNSRLRCLLFTVCRLRDDHSVKGREFRSLIRSFVETKWEFHKTPNSVTAIDNAARRATRSYAALPKEWR